MLNRDVTSLFVRACFLIVLLLSAFVTSASPRGTVPVIYTVTTGDAQGIGYPLGMKCVNNSISAVYDCVKQVVDFNTNNADTGVMTISGLSGEYQFYEATCTNFSGDALPCSFSLTINTSCPEGYAGSLKGLYCEKADDDKLSCNAGNPISIFNGEKKEISEDYSNAGIFPINFTRYYHSKTKSLSEILNGNTGGIGNNWDHYYSRGITGITKGFTDYTWSVGTDRDTSLLQIVQNDYDNNPDGHTTFVTVHHPNGSEYQFSNEYNPYTGCFVSDEWTGNVPGAERLVMGDKCVANSNYTFTASDQSIEVYDSSGLLNFYQSSTGITHNLVYNSGKLTEINHSMGDALVISYSGGNISEVTDSTSRVWSYSYDSTGNLQFVDKPDGTRIEYHYGYGAFPNVLTGVTDERGIRYSHFEYDYSGKANASYHGQQTDVLTDRIQGVKINYNSPYGNSDQLSNSNGDATNYWRQDYHGNILPTSIIGYGCVTCGASGEINYDYDPVELTLNSLEVNSLLTQYNNYNNAGKPEVVTEAAGTALARTKYYSYDPHYQNKISIKTEPSVYSGLEKKTTYGYDDFGNTTSVTIDGYRSDDGSSVNRAWSLTYNGPFHQLTEIDGPRPNIEADDRYTLEYYPKIEEGPNKARISRITAPAGVILYDEVNYTPTGKSASYTTGAGLLVEFSYYPGNDRLETLIQTDPDSNKQRKTHWTWLETGEVKSITRGYAGPEETTITFEYDNARRLTRVYDGFGNYIKYTLDTEGNIEAENVYDSGGVLKKALIQTFDDYSRLDLATQANESFNADFSPDGTLDIVVDGKGAVTDYDYDDLRRLTAIVQDQGGTDPSTANALTQIGYDVQDNLTDVTDPNDGTTTYLYDDLGNVLSTTSPDTGTTVFTYDDAGNIKTMTDAKGQLFGYSYDALGRIVTADAPGVSDDILYAYDNCEYGAGKLCSVSRGGVTVSYSYTAFGDVGSRSQSVDTFPPYENAGSQVQYTYNSAGRVQDMIYPGGNKITYTYDVAGNVYSVILNDGEVNLVTNSKYYPFGPANLVTRGNGSSIAGYMDYAYRAWIVGNGGYFYDVIYYDQNGNPVTFYSSEGGKNHTYDALDRLIASSGPYGAREYGYDTNGNRISADADGVTYSYSYDPDTNRMNNNTGNSVVLDANGNSTNLNGMTIQYTTDNRIASITGRAFYTYNGLGERSMKAIPAPGAAGAYGFTKKTVYVYGPDGKLMAETGSSGKLMQEYVYMNNQLLATITYSPSGDEAILNADMDGDGAVGIDDFIIWYYNHYLSGDAASDVTGDGRLDSDDLNAVVNCALTGGSGAGCVSSSYNRSIYYAHNDHLDTPHMLTDESGAVVWSAVYDPFGKAAVTEDVDGDGVNVTLNVRFPGQYYDAETQLHYNYFRYYEPNTGRYITADPLGIAGLMYVLGDGFTSRHANLYPYVINNPLLWIDPMGLTNLEIGPFITEDFGDGIPVTVELDNKIKGPEGEGPGIRIKYPQLPSKNPLDPKIPLPPCFPNCPPHLPQPCSFPDCPPPPKADSPTQCP